MKPNTRNRLNAALNVSVYIASVLIFGIFIFEISARMIFGDKLQKPGGDDRYVFVSADAFVNKKGYFAYRPNSTLQEVAFYPDDAGDLTPEYSCSFRSDDRGFVGNSLRYEDASVLVFGDSFASGQGSCPFNQSFPEHLRSKMYWAPIMGFGALHWKSLYDDLARDKRPQALAIVAISNDFFREDWLFAQDQLECLKYGGQSCDYHYWYPMSDDLQAVARHRYIIRNEGGRTPTRNAALLLRGSFTLYRQMRSSITAPILFKKSLAAFAEMAKNQPTVLIRVNTKDEAITGAANAQSVALSEALKKMSGLRVRECTISADGFLPRDPHPNALGGEQLSSCIQTILAQEFGL